MGGKERIEGILDPRENASDKLPRQLDLISPNFLVFVEKKI